MRHKGFLRPNYSDPDLERFSIERNRQEIERSRCRGIEVVAGVGVPAASSSVAGALAMNRPVQSDQRWINDDGDQQDLDTCKRR